MNHIQIITHLTKNAEQHRQITIPVFYVIGILFTLTGISTSLFYNHQLTTEDGLFTTYYDLTNLCWLAIFIITTISFLLASRRHIHQHETPVAYAGLKFTISTIAPILLTGLIIAWSITNNYHRAGRGLPFAASTIITFYAIALLSLKIFLPKSARILATLLLALGITSWLTSWSLIYQDILPAHLANFYLILTGLLHIITATGSLLFEKAQRPPH